MIFQKTILKNTVGEDVISTNYLGTPFKNMQDCSCQFMIISA